jgi:hypothetical protein
VGGISTTTLTVTAKVDDRLRVAPVTVTFVVTDDCLLPPVLASTTFATSIESSDAIRDYTFTGLPTLDTQGKTLVWTTASGEGTSVDPANNAVTFKSTGSGYTSGTLTQTYKLYAAYSPDLVTKYGESGTIPATLTVTEDYTAPEPSERVPPVGFGDYSRTVSAAEFSKGAGTWSVQATGDFNASRKAFKVFVISIKQIV